MIEREIIKDKFLEYKIADYIRNSLYDVPIKNILLEKNPMGEKVIIQTSAPGLVIGREGSNIKKLTQTIKDKFGLENLQIKIGEVNEIFLSSSIVAKRIANDLARFGSQKFKLTGFRTLQNILNAGAMGAEIRITGKLPASRAKSWRFAKGYIKKTGFVSDYLIDKRIEYVTLKSGVVGIKVDIMLPNTPLPDNVEYLENTVVEEVIEEKEQEKLNDEAQQEEETNQKNSKKIDEVDKK